MHCELGPEGHKVKQTNYLPHSAHSYAWSIHRKRKVEPRLWVLQQDSTLAHHSFAVQQILINHAIPTLHSTSLYSLDLVLCDFFLFPKLKSVLNGIFQDIQSIITNIMHALLVLLNNENQWCLLQLKECWKNCADAEGLYFKGYSHQ